MFILKTLLIIATFSLVLCGYNFHASSINDPLPLDFWWGNVSGTNYLIHQRNQKVPDYCGACWSFAITSSLSDRIKIMRKAQWPDIILSSQVMLSCDPTNRGCNGGDPLLAYKWIYNNNITDQSCSPYQARGHETPGYQCSNTIKCRSCTPEKGCRIEERPKIYGIKQFGKIEQNEEKIMRQIYERGPIDCQIAITPQYSAYVKGILNDTSGKKGYDHVININGWGEENGVKYWIVRNSYGSHWGEGGNFRIIRGINNLGIEQNCTWAMPFDSWTKDIRDQKKLTQNELKIKTTPVSTNCRRMSKLRFQHNLETKHKECLEGKKTIPKEWDWRNVEGKNYLSWTRDQNNPNHCNSCWAHAALSSLSDRINIARNLTWPTISLSPQMIINCKVGGNCEGGNPIQIYIYAHQIGLTEETCLNYQAKNPDTYQCSNIQRCKNCQRATPEKTPNCEAVKSYNVWKVKQYGFVLKPDEMKAQIYMRGPISCGIYVTQKFEQYKGGIYEEIGEVPSLNSEISVVGWGVQNNMEYWIGRNSWGTSWGQSGFFRIRMHKNNLGIERQCSWGGVISEPTRISIQQEQQES